PFYLLGRVVTALFGTATIAVLYGVATRLYGATVGLLASLFLSVNLLHVRDSHYVTTDVPLTCLVALSLLFVVRYGSTGRTRDAAWSGLFAGLATSMKYPGALILLALAVAHLGRSSPGGRWGWRRL